MAAQVPALPAIRLSWWIDDARIRRMLLRLFAAALAVFLRACGMPPATLAGTATISGVGFIDVPHAIGAARNGIELHPVLGFRAQVRLVPRPGRLPGGDAAAAAPAWARAITRRRPPSRAGRGLYWTGRLWSLPPQIRDRHREEWDEFKENLRSKAKAHHRRSR